MLLLVYTFLRTVTHEQFPRQENVTDLVHCIKGKFLVVPTLAARSLYVRKDTREPSGKRWNYLSKV